MEVRRRCELCGTRLMLLHEDEDTCIYCVCPNCGKVVVFKKQ